jgi:hypothetical protein
LKASIYIFVLSMLAVGSVVAQENVESASQISTAAEAVTVTDQVEDTISDASSASERRRVSSIGSEERSELRRDDGKANRSVAPSFKFDYGKNQISERAIDERIIDRLGLFDRPDDGGSGRCSVSLDLENEDSDWSFQVTFTVEF